MPAILLSNDERRALLGVLYGFADADEMSALIFAATGAAIGAYGASNNSVPVLAMKCATWLVEDLTRLAALVDQVCRTMPGLPEIPQLTALDQRLKTIAAQAPVDAFDELLIDTAVIVNRTQLRRVLRDLTMGFVRPLVFVNGARGYGRSHSWFLIRFIAASHQIGCKLYDLDSWVVEQRNLDSLVAALVKGLGLTADYVAPTTVGVTPEVRGQRLAAAVAQALANRPAGEPLWIVFDSMDRSPDAATDAFLAELCERRSTGQFQDCTLFVLGTSSTLCLSEKCAPPVAEPLGPFLPSEVADAAERINSRGTRQLSDADLQSRIATLQAELAPQWPQPISAVARQLIQLRYEAGAP